MKRRQTRSPRELRWRWCSAARAAGNDFDYCLLCHGANANGNYGIRAPKISGMEPWYLARQLENFAAGARGAAARGRAGHEMGPVGMRAESGRHARRRGGVHRHARVEAAARRPSAGDVAHGKNALRDLRGLSRREGRRQRRRCRRRRWRRARTGISSTQLANYQKGLRGADERDTYGAQMRAIVATLPDEKAIADVVAYINTLK